MLEEIVSNIENITSKKEKYDAVDNLEIYRIDTRLNHYSFASLVLDELMNEKTEITFPGFKVKNDFEDPFVCDTNDIFCNFHAVVLIRPCEAQEWVLKA